MKPNGSYYSVVLGWHTRANEEIECCLIHTTEVKAMKPTAVTKSLIRNPFRKGNKRQRSLSVDDGQSVDPAASRDQQPPILGPLIQIDCRDSSEEADFDSREEDDLIIHGDASQIELVLPQVLFREESNVRDRWQYLFLSYKVHYDDDPWIAAKRGDLEALKAFRNRIDWTEEDDFECTPLYYACHSGAARDVMVVKYLIDMWPGKIPSEILSRCKKNAINLSVIKLLENPNDANALHAAKKKADCLTNPSSYFFEGWNIFEEEEFGDY